MIISLYESPPADGKVICFDECGPLEIKPIAGECWALEKKPQRLPATYRRLQGTQQFISFYDMAADCLMGEVRERKTHLDILACLSKLRRCYPVTLKLYLVEDNLSVHKHKKVLEYIDNNNMVPVWLPTYSSWLNLIESHYRPLKKFSIRNSNYKNSTEQAEAIYNYVNWRNKQHHAENCPLTKLIKT